MTGERAHAVPDPPDPDVAPLDPDVDLTDPLQRAELAQHPLALLGAVALGGVLGSEARYGLTLVVPDAGGVPWTTFGINVLGCFAIGVLMVGVQRRWGVRRPLLRPFAGVGVLGGFTTFSAYTVGVERLLDGGRVTAALAYLVLTPLAAVAAAVAGQQTGRRLL